MNIVLISTKGSAKNNRMFAWGCFGSAVFAFVAILKYMNDLSKVPSYMQDYAWDEVKPLMLILAFMCILCSVIGMHYYLLSKTYIEVYEDHVEGAGIQRGLNLINFSLPCESITHVTTNVLDISKVQNKTVVGFLDIHTNHGKYRISTKAKMAKTVFDRLNK